MISHSKLPAAGLGNKLFSWAAGHVFSVVNGCPHIITGMTKIHLGPILRGETSFRFYRGYFANERLFLPIYYKTLAKKRLHQNQAAEKAHENACFEFSEIPHWSDQFYVLREFRDVIIKAFWSTLNANILTRIDAHEAPVLSVHVRMGDFRALNDNEDFSKVGAVRTPSEYFIQTIEKIRAFVGYDMEVTVFSDGKDHELDWLLSLPKVRRATDDLDIVHLAIMSKSRIIVMSAGSTFSFWSGFLSDAVLINHYLHLHAPIRPNSINLAQYEGGLAPEDSIDNIPLLKTSLERFKNPKNATA